MEDKYRLPNRQRSEIWKSMKNEDFDEEVWDTVKEIPETDEPSNNEVSSLLSVPRFLPTAATMIPITNSGSSFSSQETKSLRQSAPIKIPDWSKIYRKKQNKTSKNVYDFYCEDEDDYEYHTRLPPHEIIARRSAMKSISSFSVLEGVGRTLKGRDLSKMRNAVLIKTGFLESL